MIELSNHDRVGKALGLLHQGLYPFVEREMLAEYGKGWIIEATPYVPSALQQDVLALLKVMNSAWNQAFKGKLSQTERALVNELQDTRNKWAHNFTYPSNNDDAYRALDSMERLLRATDASAEADEVKKLKQYQSPPSQAIPPKPERKMRTIAIHAAKGGVGKTTLVVNLAYELAKKGKRVLVVDLDDSANTSLLK